MHNNPSKRVIIASFSLPRLFPINDRVKWVCKGKGTGTRWNGKGKTEGRNQREEEDRVMDEVLRRKLNTQ